MANAPSLSRLSRSACRFFLPHAGVELRNTRQQFIYWEVNSNAQIESQNVYIEKSHIGLLLLVLARNFTYLQPS